MSAIGAESRLLSRRGDTCGFDPQQSSWGCQFALQQSVGRLLDRLVGDEGEHAWRYLDAKRLAPFEG